VFINELRNAVEQLLSVIVSLERILFEEYLLAMATTAEVDSDFSMWSGGEDASFDMKAQEKLLRSALQVILIVIADLGRLQLKYTLFREGVDAAASDHELRTQTEVQVEVYRQRALSIAPHDGSPYESMSKLAVATVLDSKGQSRRKKDTFLSAYYLARGMGAEVNNSM
jgi:hypothetical protein